jgi:cell division protein FtsB
VTPTPPRPRRWGQLTGLQIMFAAILAIGLSATITFTSRIATGQPILDAYRNVQVEIEQLRQQQADLLAERDYVRSDAYVENWARSEGKMIRPGEVLIIPVPAAADIAQEAPPAVVTAPIQTTPPKPEAWKLWWALLFDGPPPQF